MLVGAWLGLSFPFAQPWRSLPRVSLLTEDEKKKRNEKRKGSRSQSRVALRCNSICSVSGRFNLEINKKNLSSWLNRSLKRGEEWEKQMRRREGKAELPTFPSHLASLSDASGGRVGGTETLRIDFQLLISSSTRSNLKNSRNSRLNEPERKTKPMNRNEWLMSSSRGWGFCCISPSSFFSREPIHLNPLVSRSRDISMRGEQIYLQCLVESSRRFSSASIKGGIVDVETFRKKWINFAFHRLITKASLGKWWHRLFVN